MCLELFFADILEQVSIIISTGSNNADRNLEVTFSIGVRVGEESCKHPLGSLPPHFYLIPCLLSLTKASSVLNPSTVKHRIHTFTKGDKYECSFEAWQKSVVSAVF